MLIAIPIIVIVIGLATIVAIQFLPDVDKDFSTESSLLVDNGCDITVAMQELKLVNTLDEGDVHNDMQSLQCRECRHL